MERWRLWGFALSGSGGEGNRRTGRCIGREDSGDGVGGKSRGWMRDSGQEGNGVVGGLVRQCRKLGGGLELWKRRKVNS